MSDPQPWGGCVVNRVGNRFFGQPVRSGHQDRSGELELFAGLGLRALCHPVLWESASAHDPGPVGFGCHDAPLAELPRLGLVHHRSGPACTSLLADGSGPGLAAHARATAERYPWVQNWTPVNEAPTTAGFSWPYDHWHPHPQRGDPCWLALLNQSDATLRHARDPGRQSRGPAGPDRGPGLLPRQPRPAAEPAFENECRWLTRNLLCGHVVPGHPT